MFCRNCGRELTGTPEICTHCGAKPMSGTSFCPSCAAPTTPLSRTCPECGTAIARGDGSETWQPTVAGILCIIAGVLQVLSGMTIALLTGITGAFFWAGWLAITGAPLVVFGIIAIVGGIYATRRQLWGLGLAGSICALVGPWFVLGILAIIFIATGKNEFA